jgi:hypothetical protein
MLFGQFDGSFHAASSQRRDHCLTPAFLQLAADQAGKSRLLQEHAAGKDKLDGSAAGKKVARARRRITRETVRGPLQNVRGDGIALLPCCKHLQRQTSHLLFPGLKHPINEVVRFVQEKRAKNTTSQN